MVESYGKCSNLYMEMIPPTLGKLPRSGIVESYDVALTFLFNCSIVLQSSRWHFCTFTGVMRKFSPCTLFPKPDKAFDFCFSDTANYTHCGF